MENIVAKLECNAQDRVNRLIERLEEVDRIVDSQSISDRDLVLVLGNTGAGKSTFINYMLGCEMVEDVNDSTGDIRIDCSNPQAKIGHGLTSETQLPEIFCGTGSELTFCDCPGFSDNRGVEMDIANMYSIARLAKAARSIQGIVFLVSFHALQDCRAQSLNGAVSMLSAIMGDSWKSPEVQRNILPLVTGAAFNRRQDQVRQKLLDVAMEKGDIPADLANRAEAYDPLDRAPAKLLWLCKENIMNELSGFSGLPPANNLSFALSESSQLCLGELMDTLQKQAQDLMDRHHFKEVQNILLLQERLTALNCPSVAEKAQSLLERLKLQVGEWAVQDDNLHLLQQIQQELPMLAEDAEKSIKFIEERLAEKQELKDAINRAEAAAAKERTAREAYEKHFEEVKEKVTEKFTKLSKAYKSVKKQNDDLQCRLEALTLNPPRPDPQIIHITSGGGM